MLIESAPNVATQIFQASIIQVSSDVNELHRSFSYARALANNENFIVKAVARADAVKELLEVGFEYVCEKNGLMFFRKRK